MFEPTGPKEVIEKMMGDANNLSFYFKQMTQEYDSANGNRARCIYLANGFEQIYKQVEVLLSEYEGK